MKYTELPFRHISADDEVARMMAERGETLDDVLWCSPECSKRAADFTHGVMLTKKHVYTVLVDDWCADGGLVPRVFVNAHGGVP